VLIKKYGNRRLYDTLQSRYITLEDLAAIVRQGTDVKVVEANTSRDLTRQVLTQVILEQQDSLDMIPVEFLVAIIRVQGTIDQAPFSSFLVTLVKQFSEAGNAWARQFAGFFGSTLDEDPGAVPTADRPGGQPPADGPGAEASPQPGDIHDLRRRVDALLDKLAK
jgi:polyhydroxyalkanoate synthesis repressor PhaR